jgi:hypothetical protein
MLAFLVSVNPKPFLLNCLQPITDVVLVVLVVCTAIVNILEPHVCMYMYVLLW